MTDDPRAARLLAAEKEAFRDMEAAATRAHFLRLRQGRIDTAETSALHLDVIRDLKRINSTSSPAPPTRCSSAAASCCPTRIQTSRAE